MNKPRRLILVKHSLPDIIPNVPPNQWHLSEAGRARCKPLAEQLREYDPNVIISSDEPKAVETAQIVGKELGTPVELFQGLHEHERSNVEWLGEEQFEKSIADFFANPNELVFGAETANGAYKRFSNAVARVIEKYPHGNLCVVAHGTVITLLVWRKTGSLKPIEFWKRLGLPSFAVLAFPDRITARSTAETIMVLQKVVENVE